MNPHVPHPSIVPPPRTAPAMTQIMNGPANSVQYFVFSADNEHIGPVSAELIGKGVAAGKVPSDAFVAAAGTSQWVSLAAVPEIARAIEVARSGANAPSAVPARPSPLPPAPSVSAAPNPMPAAPSPMPAAPSPIAAAPNATVGAPTVFSPPPRAGNEIPAPLAANVPAEVRAAEPAKAEGDKKAGVLPSTYKLLPLLIFGGFAFIGMVETALTLLLR